MKPYVHRSGKWVGIGEHCQECQIFHSTNIILRIAEGELLG